VYRDPAGYKAEAGGQQTGRVEADDNLTRSEKREVNVKDCEFKNVWVLFRFKREKCNTPQLTLAVAETAEQRTRAEDERGRENPVTSYEHAPELKSRAGHLKESGVR
jgi:hypothetical protein